MGNNMVRFVFIWMMLMQVNEINAQEQAAASLHRAQRAVTAVIVHDIFSPPVASRIYMYSSLAAYEALTVSPNVRSFKNLRKDFPRLDPKGQTVDPTISSIGALLYTAARFVFSDSSMLDSMQQILKPYRTHALYTASLAWGKRVSDSIFSWSKTDGYLHTRKLRRYTYHKTAGAWRPTPPGYMAAVEPYWGQIRTIVLDSLEKFRPPLSIPFSTDSSSIFYRQAKEVYTASQKLSKEDTAIAMFWDCNPFYLNTQGHLNFATKKLSPGGHWMSIAGIAAEKRNADFQSAVKAYFFTATALFDAFISCWDEKYRSHVIRPESYINAYINESWRPILQTPPFPEYTSGHSVISASAAEVLTACFGAFTFDDHTETGYGLPVRRFSSFHAAANEAGISRFYGGIHYQSAVENGLIQGRKIGEAVVDQLVNRLK